MDEGKEPQYRVTDGSNRFWREFGARYPSTAHNQARLIAEKNPDHAAALRLEQKVPNNGWSLVGMVRRLATGRVE